MGQANPTAGARNVTPEARRVFLEMLTEREAEGIAKYGTTLQTFNGRDALQDAMEEAIDLWQYLSQLGMERVALRRVIDGVARLYAIKAETGSAPKRPLQVLNAMFAVLAELETDLVNLTKK